MKLSVRLPGIFAIMAFFTVLAISLFAFSVGQNIISSDIAASMSTNAEFQANAISRWLHDRATVLTIDANRPLRREQLTRLLSLSPDSAEYGSLYNDIRDNFLLPILTDDNLQGVIIVRASDGQIILATDEDDIGKYRDNETFFTEGLIDTYIDDFRYFPYEGSITLHISSPIRNADQETIAVMVVHTNLEKITDILHEIEDPNKHLESYLLNKANFFVTDPWLSDKQALKDTLKTTGTTACLAGNTGTNIYADYRGVEVIGAYQWMPEFELCLMTEYDLDQAYAPIDALRKQLISASLVIALFFGLVGYAFSRRITDPIRKLVKATQAIAKGDLTQSVDVTSKDEIGTLGEAFNEMTQDLIASQAENQKLYDELQQWATTLEKRVDERTAELQVSEGKYRSLSENSPDLIMMIDIANKYVYSNPQTNALFGFKEEDAEGKPYSELFGPVFSEFVKGSLLRVKLNNKIIRGEAEIEVWGEKRWLDTQFVPIMDDTGNLALYLLISRDITNNKLAEKQILKLNENLQRSNEDLERFAYIASHDLQEPLRMVASYLQLLERRYKPKLDSDAIEFIDYAVDGATRMKTLIQDLLSYSRVSTRGKEFEPVDVQTVIDKVLKDLELAVNENHATITVDPMPTLSIDDIQFHQLILNLVSNAIKFRGDPDPVIHIGAVEKEEEWEFSVKDNGIGIDPQYFDRIFLIFQRLHTRDKYSGTGIGLSVSKRIVERHGGKIRVESSKGNGANFIFTIPKAPSRSE